MNETIFTTREGLQVAMLFSEDMVIYQHLNCDSDIIPLFHPKTATIEFIGDKELKLCITYKCELCGQDFDINEFLPMSNTTIDLEKWK